MRLKRQCDDWRWYVTFDSAQDDPTASYLRCPDDATHTVDVGHDTGASGLRFFCPQHIKPFQHSRLYSSAVRNRPC